MEHTEEYVKLEKVSKIYGSKEVKIIAVDEISFRNKKRRICGCGRTKRCRKDNGAEYPGRNG